MSQALRVGLLGCGRLGSEVMLPLLAARRDVEVSLVADRDEAARTRAQAHAPAASLERDWRSAIERPGLDAVVVSLPTSLHAEAVLACLARRLPVYLEKPLASTLDQASAVRAAWRDAGVTVGLGFNGRFHPLVLQLRTLVAERRIGRPRVVRCAFTVAAGTGGSWRHHEAEGGGVLHDLASHHVDLARFLLGPIMRVGATRAVVEGAETVVVAAEMAGDILLSATWASGTIDEDVIEVVGTEGAVRLSRYEDLSLAPRGRAVPGPSARWTRVMPTVDAVRFGLLKRRSPWHDPSFAPALDNFLSAVRTGVPAVPGIDEGWHSVRVVDAIARAVDSRHMVEIGPEDESA